MRSIKDFFSSVQLPLLTPVLERARRHKKVAAGVLVVVLLLAIALPFTRSGGAGRVAPQTGPLVEAVYALGTVKSPHVFSLKAGVSAGIAKLHVSEGDPVRAGDPLVTTDSNLFRAPFDGTVSRINVEKGETVMPGSPVMTVTDLRDLYVIVSLDQESALRIKEGQKAELVFESLRGTKLKGNVSRRYSSDGQFLVKIEVEDLPPEILPDMTADVAIEVARRENILQIPVKAIRAGKVRILREGKKITVQAKLGAVSGEWAEVLDDSVRSGDEILIPE